MISRQHVDFLLRVNLLDAPRVLKDQLQRAQDVGFSIPLEGAGGRPRLRVVDGPGQSSPAARRRACLPVPADVMMVASSSADSCLAWLMPIASSATACSRTFERADFQPRPADLLRLA